LEASRGSAPRLNFEEEIDCDAPPSANADPADNGQIAV